MSKLSDQKTKAEGQRYAASCLVYGIGWMILALASLIYLFISLGEGSGVGILIGLFCAIGGVYFGWVRIRETISYYRLRSMFRSGDPDCVNDPELKILFGDGA